MKSVQITQVKNGFIIDVCCSPSVYVADSIWDISKVLEEIFTNGVDAKEVPSE